MHELFAGTDTGPRADIIAINAAAGLLVAGIVKDMGAGLEAAKAVMTDGRAAAKVEAVVNLSKEIAD